MKNSKIKITLLTDSRYTQRNNSSEYIKNIFREDDLVIQALSSRGFQVERIAWDDPTYGWGNTDYAIFRTTWDYFNRIDDFTKWYLSTKEKLRFINPPELIDWNINKLYLKDLDQAGINVLEMVLVDNQNSLTIEAVMELKGWNEVIIKPLVSASARHTYKIDHSNRLNYENLFAQLIKSETMIVQEFQHSIIATGEIAMMYFNGQFSHSVLKRAIAGDFRVQDDFGGTVHQYQASIEQINLGKEALEVNNSMPVYARVDIIKDNSDNWAVTELELIEPELWFRYYPPAADLFTEAIKRYVDSSSS